MIVDEQARIVGDRIAAATGAAGAGGWTVAEVAHLANDLIPPMTLLMLALTCVWYGWRMVDRWRFGPAVKRGGDDE